MQAMKEYSYAFFVQVHEGKIFLGYSKTTLIIDLVHKGPTRLCQCLGVKYQRWSLKLNFSQKAMVWTFSKRPNHEEDCANFCGLLRKAELYVVLLNFTNTNLDNDFFQNPKYT